MSNSFPGERQPKLSALYQLPGALCSYLVWGLKATKLMPPSKVWQVSSKVLSSCQFRSTMAVSVPSQCCKSNICPQEPSSGQIRKRASLFFSRAAVMSRIVCTNSVSASGRIFAALHPSSHSARLERSRPWPSVTR